MTKQITQFDLKRIKGGLKMGDIAKITARTGYSAQTVQNALKGYSIDHAGRIIIPVALEVVKENQLEAERIYKEGKAAFERQKKSNPQ